MKIAAYLVAVIPLILVGICVLALIEAMYLGAAG